MFCGHLAVYSETFPASGSMRSGVLYEHETQAPLTTGPGSSSSPGLLPTPAAGNFNDGEDLES